MQLKNKILLAALALTSQVNAEVVTVTGYGQDYNQALFNAKIAALEKVAGTFIMSDTVYRTNENIFEQIKTYNGGHIKSYEVTKATDHEVTIKADVDIIKDNKILIDNGNMDRDKMNASMDNFEQKSGIINYLDKPESAFHINTRDIVFDPKGQFVTFKINSTMQWQPKWVSDIESFSRNNSTSGNTHTDTVDRISSGIINKLTGIHPMAGVVGYYATNAINKPPQISQQPMVCIGSYKRNDIDACYNITNKFYNMPIFSTMRVQVIGYDEGGAQIYKRLVSIQNESMYDNVYAGTTKEFKFGVKRTFDQPTTIIYKNEVNMFTVAVDVKNDIARKLYKFEIKPV